MPTAAEGDGPQSVVGRVLTLLTAFRPGDAELTLAELHRPTGIAKPTIHRLLAELEGVEVVYVQKRDGRRGPRVVRRGPGARRGRDGGRGHLDHRVDQRLDPDRLAPAVRTAALGVSRVLRERAG